MPHPLLELGGSGAPLLLLPANGFPPDTYVPALEPLFAGYRVLSLPPRGFWEDAGPAPPEPGSWVTFAEDVLFGVARYGLNGAVVVGHSFGGVAALLAAVRAPFAFRKMVLLDPTIFPPTTLPQFVPERERGERLARQLVQGALNRKDRFSSLEAAFAYWREKPLFADWSDAVLWRYTRSMLRVRDGAYALAWPREWEAHYYQSAYPDLWKELPRLPRLPLLVVRGERSDTFSAAAAESLQEQAPWARQAVLAGCGHLFPQSAPGETGALLSGWLLSDFPA